MADTTIQKQNTVWISESEYKAKKLAGTLENNTVYNITKATDVGIDSITSLNLSSSDATITYDSSSGININNTAKVEYGEGEKTFTTSQNIPIVPGDGITIDKKSGSEQVEIKVEDGKYLPIKTPSEKNLYVYAINQNGDQILEIYTNNPISWSIVRRNSTGQSEFTAPTADAHAVTLGYANNHFVAKHSEATATHQAYVKNPNGTQTMFGMARTTTEANTIAVRDINGVLKVGTPVSSSDATTKAYVDGEIASAKRFAHYISLNYAQTDSSPSEVCEIYCTIFNNDDTEILDVSTLEQALDNLVGTDAPIQASGIYVRKEDQVTSIYSVYSILVSSSSKVQYKTTEGLAKEIDDSWTITDTVIS